MQLVDGIADSQSRWQSVLILMERQVYEFTMRVHWVKLTHRQDVIASNH